MGEYAARKNDKKKIKIGTCNLMYYLRYEQRKEVVSDHPLQLNKLWFRLSLKEEDGILPGDFEYLRARRFASSGICCQDR